MVASLSSTSMFLLQSFPALPWPPSALQDRRFLFRAVHITQCQCFNQVILLMAILWHCHTFRALRCWKCVLPEHVQGSGLSLCFNFFLLFSASAPKYVTFSSQRCYKNNWWHCNIFCEANGVKQPQHKCPIFYRGILGTVPKFYQVFYFAVQV